MTHFAHFKEVVTTYSDVADFLLIYIKEVHPSDGFSYKNNVSIKTHRRIKDRIAAAHILADRKLSCPIVVDNMEDEANWAYCAFPERLYIIRDRKIVYQRGRGPGDYYVAPVRAWLEKYAGF